MLCLWTSEFLIPHFPKWEDLLSCSLIHCSVLGCRFSLLALGHQKTTGYNQSRWRKLHVKQTSWSITYMYGTPLQYSCLEIPWTEEPGGLQSMGSLRVGHDWATSLSLFTFMHWRRKWQPTPVFLPGESQGRESLVGCRLWDRTESDTTEATNSYSKLSGSI